MTASGTREGTGLLTRDLGVHMMAASGEINKLLDSCPHGAAMKIKDKLAVFADVADSAFPGGYAGECIYCEEPIGFDECVYSGDERALSPTEGE